MGHPAASAGVQAVSTIQVCLPHPAHRSAETTNVSARPRPAEAKGVLLCEPTENCCPRPWQPQVTRPRRTGLGLFAPSGEKSQSCGRFCQRPCQPRSAHVPRPAPARKAASAQETVEEAPLSLLFLPFRLPAPLRGRIQGLPPPYLRLQKETILDKL